MQPHQDNKTQCGSRGTRSDRGNRVNKAICIYIHTFFFSFSYYFSPRERVHILRSTRPQCIPTIAISGGHKSPALLSVGPLAHTASTDNTVSLIIPVSPGPKHSSFFLFFSFFSPPLDPHRCSIRDKCLYAIRSAAPITSLSLSLTTVPRNAAEVNCCKLRLHKEPTVISQAVSPHKLLQTKPRDERNA